MEPTVMSTEPLTELRRRLAEARRRGEGFDQCWAPTVRDVLAGIRPADRREWRDCFAHTRSTWQRAFDREAQTPAELALAHAASILDREPMPDLACETCGNEVPTAGRQRRRYCSEDCRKAASGLNNGGHAGAKQTPGLPVLEPEDWSTEEQLELAA